MLIQCHFTRQIFKNRQIHNSLINLFQISCNLKSAFLWVITQPIVVILYRRFETTSRSHHQGQRISWPLKIEPKICPETTVRNYRCTLRNNPEERKHLIRGWSLKSRILQSVFNFAFCFHFGHNNIKFEFVRIIRQSCVCCLGHLQGFVPAMHCVMGVRDNTQAHTHTHTHTHTRKHIISHSSTHDQIHPFQTHNRKPMKMLVYTHCQPYGDPTQHTARVFCPSSPNFFQMNPQYEVFLWRHPIAALLSSLFLRERKVRGS
jgi:hypothetical protein